MLGAILLAVAALASHGWCRSIETSAQRALKEVYSSKYALIPGIHDSVDAPKDFNIVPRDNVTMYYGPGPGSDNPTAAFVTYSNMRFKTVSLEQVKSIASVNCANSKINVQFSNKDAYEQAQEAWRATGLGNGLMLITHQEGCGLAWPEQRSFLYMTSFSQKFSPETLTISGNIKEVKPLAAAKAVDIQFGQYIAAAEHDPDTKRLATMPEFDPVVNIPINFFPLADADTQFGKATTLYSYKDDTPVGTADAGVFCVGCGAKGALKINGHVSLGLNGYLPQMNRLAVDVDLNMNARIALAAAGQFPPSGAIKSRLIDSHFGPFSIGDIVAIKPTLTLDFAGNAESKLTGGAMYGYELDWLSLRAKGDLASRTYDTSGLEPNLKIIADTSRKAEAKIIAEPNLAIQIIADVLMGQFQGKLTINDKPTIDIAAKSIDGCVHANVKNSLSVDASVAGQSMSWPAIPFTLPQSTYCSGADVLVVPKPLTMPQPMPKLPEPSSAPSAPAPSSAAPSAVDQSSAAPSSATPSSAAPSSATPSSAAPSAADPSSATPSSAAPSSADLSSADPSSAAPTSATPSSVAPSSAAPSSAATSAADSSAEAPSAPESSGPASSSEPPPAEDIPAIVVPPTPDMPGPVPEPVKPAAGS